MMEVSDGNEIQSGEEDNTVKQNSVSIDIVEVSDSRENRGKVKHTYSIREGNSLLKCFSIVHFRFYDFFFN